MKMILTLIIFRNVSGAANHPIRMISEGSCDSEDWSNGAENSALPSHFKLYIQKVLFQMKLDAASWHLQYGNASVYGNASGPLDS